MKPSITVLMSTYNGEKYLREQIDSVLAQQNVDVRLEIRDDGSKDNTIGIIEEYALAETRITLYKGKNVGPNNSFFWLVENAPSSNYYAFCDQDDYWEKDKLSVAISRLEELNSNKPSMYCSNLSIVDENLTFCHLSQANKIRTINKYSALVDFYAVGCTEVFNFAAAELFRKKYSEDALMHDSWLFLLCTFFGNVIYDDTPHIKYRQHSQNVIGTKMKKIDFIIDSMKRITDKTIQPRLRSAIAFNSVFSNDLLPEDKLKIERVANYKKSLINRLLLLFDKDIRSNHLFTDLKYRILILLGMI